MVLTNLESRSNLFIDFVVGAPYEGGNVGAVYIYHGSENGVVEPYSQVKVFIYTIQCPMPVYMRMGHEVCDICLKKSLF